MLSDALILLLEYASDKPQLLASGYVTIRATTSASSSSSRNIN